MKVKETKMKETRQIMYVFANDAMELAQKLQGFGEQLIDWRVIDQKPSKIDVIVTVVR